MTDRTTHPMRARAAALCAAAAALLPACMPMVQPGGEADPAVAAEAVHATRPDRPLHVIFDWRAREAEAVFNGRGAARMQPEYRARLDLFGPRGETVLIAGLVGGDLAMPGTPGVAVPPPPLLWSTLGVLWPPAGGELVVATRDSRDRVRLEYAVGPDRWRFLLEDGRLRRAEWDPRGAGRHTVELRGLDPSGLPREAVYRDWAAFVELTITLDEVEHADPFPEDVFRPAGP